MIPVYYVIRVLLGYKKILIKIHKILLKDYIYLYRSSPGPIKFMLKIVLQDLLLPLLFFLLLLLALALHILMDLSLFVL
jgi:hypothetical protein